MHDKNGQGSLIYRKKELHVLQGPCPTCNEDVTTYFGDILTISGNRELNQVVCSNCKSKLDINATKRQVHSKATPGNSATRACMGAQNEVTGMVSQTQTSKSDVE